MSNCYCYWPYQASSTEIRISSSGHCFRFKISKKRFAPQNYKKCLGRKKTFCMQGRTLLMNHGNFQPSTCSTLSRWLGQCWWPCILCCLPGHESAGEQKCYWQGSKERILLLLAREALSNPELSEHLSWFLFCTQLLSFARAELNYFWDLPSSLRFGQNWPHISNITRKTWPC